jgi:zinc protease
MQGDDTPGWWRHVPSGWRYTFGVLRLLVSLVVLLGATAPTLAADAVTATTLDNGLRVLLVEDHRSPVVSFQVWYRVGSRNETRGRTGLAHFLEHMMFKGTPTHGPRQYSRRVEQNGGQDNAFTSQDVTAYYVNIAGDRLDLVIDLEADRQQNLLLEPKEIDSERQVVLEERRMRTEDDPGGFLAEEVSSIAFKAHPYGQPVVGWSEDVTRVTPEAMRAFYRTYYVPNNAMVVAVGDFRAPEVLEKIKSRFGSIPRGPDPPPVLAIEPPQNGERRVVVTRQAELPIVYIAYHVPGHTSDDAPALEVLSGVLSGGRASRLYRSLVYDSQIALEAGGDYSSFMLDPYLFWFWATPLPGQTPEKVEAALLAQMERLKNDAVDAEELQRAKNQIEAEFVFAQDSVHQRATQLAQFELTGGYALQAKYLDTIRAVTASDLMRVARFYFPPDRKNVGVLLPKP